MNNTTSVHYENGTCGRHELVTGEVLLENSKAVVVVTPRVTHYIPWHRVIRVVEHTEEESK